MWYRLKQNYHCVCMFISVIFGSIMDGVSDRCHICDVCGRGYRWSTGLAQHKRVECGKEANFKCSYCSYKAKQKVNLTSHIKRRHWDILKLNFSGQSDEKNFD